MKIPQNLMQKAIEVLDERTIKLVTVEEILNHKFDPQPWLIEGLIPQQSITAITGAPGAFKTWLTLEIAKCVSRGEDFVGKFKSTKGKVLIVDKENHMQHIQPRLQMLGVQKEDIVYVTKKEGFFIDDERDFANLIEIIKEKEIKLVIFDSLVRIHSGDENEARHIAKVMNAFRKLTNYKTTVLFIHHNRKEGLRAQSTTNSMRGSSDILAALDSLLQVSKLPDTTLNITQSKLRQDEEVKPFRVKVIIDKGNNTMQFVYAGDGEKSGVSVYETKELILEILEERGQLSRQEALEELKESYSTATVDRALKELSESSKIVRGTGVSNRHSYTLSRNSE